MRFLLIGIMVPISKTAFASDFGSSDGYSNNEVNRQNIVNKTLRTKLLKNKLSGDGGVIVNVTIPRKNKYSLSYRLKFEDDFDFVRGGKLPGLAGGKAYTGGSNTDAGDGWSYRVMWRKYDHVNGGKPYLEPYIYYVDMPKTYGDDFGAKYFVDSGKWYTVRIEIEMNTGTSRNGKFFYVCE